MEKLLLLHGALGSASDLQPVAKALEGQFDCVIFEFPGHGKTPVGQYTFHINGFKEALSRFVDQQVLQGCAVFGYSMGGFVATKLQSETNCFGAIYTLGTKFIWNPESSAKEAGQLNAAAIQERFPAYAAKLAQQHTAMGWEAHLEATAAMMLQLGHEEVLSEAAFAQIEIPIAVGLGDRDKMIPLTDAMSIYKKLSIGCLDVLPYTQHPLDRLDLELLSSRLRSFFSRRPA